MRKTFDHNVQDVLYSKDPSTIVNLYNEITNKIIYIMSILNSSLVSKHYWNVNWGSMKNVSGLDIFNGESE